MFMEYELRRSRRKTLAVYTDKEGRLIVRAPYSVTDREIERFLEIREKDIQIYLEKQMEKRKSLEDVRVLSDEEILRLKENAAKVITQRVVTLSERLGISYGRIGIRLQKTRWGSCSAKGNLSFNAVISIMPEEIMDYVIIHELCHRIEMNHSGRFWSLIGDAIPDYREKRKWLKENGDRYMRMVNLR